MILKIKINIRNSNELLNMEDARKVYIKIAIIGKIPADIAVTAKRKIMPRLPLNE
jgi:hypothetical protein